MEYLVAASLNTATRGWVPVAGGVLSVLAFAATGLVLAGTAAERGGRRLAVGRVVCVAFTGLLAAAGLLGLFMRWACAVACVAFLLAVLAVALRCGLGTSLQAYLDAPSGDGEPSWWPAFERGYRRHAGTPRREQNPPRRAVTRPSSQTTDPEPGRVVKRSPDVTSGGRP